LLYDPFIAANNRSNKMAARGMHLVVSGKIGSWACRVACGNSRAILAGDYPTFMKDGAIRCGKCANSKQAAFFARKVAEHHANQTAAMQA
jgi:hypothetical protein